jgi:hypothetical protein
MKKRAIYLAIILCTCFVTIFTINFFKSHAEGSGFNRNIVVIPTKIIGEYALPPNLLYYAGITDRGLFFKDLSSKTASIFALNEALTSLKIQTLIPSGDSTAKQKVDLGITDTSFYTTNLTSGKLTIISGNTGTRQTFKNFKSKVDQTQLLSDKSLIGRGVSIVKGQLQRNLVKIAYQKSEIEKKYIIKEQIDGFFINDGMLQFDKENALIFYMFFYNGSFMCLDTNLNLLYEKKTIDTISKVTLKTAKLFKNDIKGGETTYTQSTPPKIVNKNFTIYKNQIYVLSRLKADNETSAFENNQIVDVYRVKDGTYNYSFYIPKYKRKRLREFRIKDNFIFALYSTHVVKYQFTK